MTEETQTQETYVRYMLARLNRAETLEDAKTIGRAIKGALFGEIRTLDDEERE